MYDQIKQETKMEGESLCLRCKHFDPKEPYNALYHKACMYDLPGYSLPIKKCSKFEEKKLIKIGIVGSRWRTEREAIRNILLDCIEIYDDFMVISGGSDGIDTTAENLCKEMGITFEKEKYRPDLKNIKGYYDAVNRYYNRNKLIGRDADYLFAFPMNREGGTMNTVEHFLNYHNKNRLEIID